MKRGSVVIATAPGFGTKPRPCVVMQSDPCLGLTTIIAIPLTTRLSNLPWSLRPTIVPDEDNGLLEVSEAMVNVPMAVHSHKIHQHIGTLAPADIARIEQALVLILGIEGRAT